MACLPPATATATIQHHPHRDHRHLLTCSQLNSSSTLPLSFLSSSTNYTSLSPFHPHRSFLPFHSNHFAPSFRFLAASPGPPSSPPPPPPNPESDPEPGLSTGFEATFSRFQNRVQIFIAVLFWMSLFFWACAWDDRNNGRSNKGSRFRR